MNNHPKAVVRIVKLIALLSPLLLAGCGENWVAKVTPPGFQENLSATAPRQPAA
ncbi:MAG: hypothetical protein JNL04_06960 [Rhodospirillaceae bacterium]|nr:hypothetical protein [Rhodospirillaceae bacterium]